ncbi:MAG: hypothetical protein ACHQRJ_13340 [Alphaproteobacteria bacterium]
MSSSSAPPEPRDPRLWNARTREIVCEMEALAHGDRAKAVELLLARCVEDPELADDVLGSERHDALMDAALAEVRELHPGIEHDRLRWAEEAFALLARRTAAGSA